MHDVVEPIWRGPSRCHVDLYIDDTGFDITHHEPKACAKKAYLVWLQVKQRLEAAQLPLSAGKSAWICSNARTEKELTKLLSEDDPQVKSLRLRMGAETSYHDAQGSFQQGIGRQSRLAALAPAHKARVTACKQGVFGVALYGHVAVGLAPKRLKWVRHQHAMVLGRMSLGSTEAVIEQAANKHEDPAYTIINQHFRFLHKLLVAWNQNPFSDLEEAFAHWVMRVHHHKEPWRIVVGPFGAAACYLKALGWKALSLTQWKVGEETFNLLNRASMHGLSLRLKQACDGWRWAALARSEKGHTLQSGVDWQAPRKALKQCKGLQNRALVAVWQGAIRHGHGAWCSRCNQEATLEHVLWNCEWWRLNHPEPPEFVKLRQQYPDPSLWLRGLGPIRGGRNFPAGPGGGPGNLLCH